MNETNKSSKSRTVVSGALLFLSLGILTINFQNCSGVSSSNYGDEEVVSDGSGSIVDDFLPIGNVTSTPNIETGINAVFAEGDSFNGQTLVSSGSFIDNFLDRLSYTTYSSGKAIAVASSGLGYAALTGGSNIEAERMAIESCNLLTGDECALIVSGNTFVVSSDDISNNMEYYLDSLNGKVFSASEIPMASTAKRDTAMVRNFTNAPGRKQGSIDYTNNDVLAMPPPASRSSSLNSITTLLKEQGQKKYAIYATPNGHGYFGRDEDDNDKAASQALSLCEAGVHGSRCILYASSRGVHINPENTMAKTNFGSVYCKLPRYSCAEHRSAGCTDSGDYWVQDSSTLESVVMSCN